MADAVLAVAAMMEVNLACALPLLFWSLAFLCLAHFKTWRESMVLASVVWMVLAWLVSELLSMSRALTFQWTVGFWALSCFVILLVLIKVRKSARLSPVVISLTRPTEVLEMLLWTGMALILSCTLIIALVAPPNNWDSLFYHVPRVAHWIQNRCVWPYPTHVPRQIISAPGAEYAILQLMLLSQSDRLVNLVQWFALVGSAVAVSLIAREFGVSARAQTVAAAFTLSIPMAILESESAPNDLVVAFLLSTTIWIWLSWEKENLRSKRILWACLSAVTMGLGFLTKGTFGVLVLPFGLYLMVRILWKDRVAGFLDLSLMVAIVLAINVPFLLRNQLLFGDPFGRINGQLVSQLHGVQGITVDTACWGLVKNVAVECLTPSDELNLNLERLIIRLDGTSSLNHVNRWGTNPPHQPFSLRFMLPFNDAYAGCPLHMMLIAWAVLTLVLAPRYFRDNRRLLTLLMLSIASLVLYSTILRWQPWQNRLLLPWVILVMPTGAVVLSSRFGDTTATAIAVILVYICQPWVWQSQLHPLIGYRNIFSVPRAEQYLTQSQESSVYWHLLKSLGAVRPRSIGLVCDQESFEYPLWADYRVGEHQTVRIEHIDLPDTSPLTAAQAVSPDFIPDAIVIMDVPVPGKVCYLGNRYAKVWGASGTWGLFVLSAR